MTRRIPTSALLSLALTGALLLSASPASAQEAAETPSKESITLLGPGAGDKPAAGAPPGMMATADEYKVYRTAVDTRSYTAAREAAEQLLERDPESVPALFVLGYVHHYGEGNLPRSAYYLEEALETLRDRRGDPVARPHAEWDRHILRELGRTNSELGRYEEAIDNYEEHDRRHPRVKLKEKISTVWPLIQLRRFDDALFVAHSILRDPETSPSDRAVALNGYVAVLFERGDRQEAHKWATQLTTEYPDVPTYWLNAAETARGLMKLDEAERMSRESIERGISDYGHPWIDLAELYMRQGRHKDAYTALVKDRGYRESRPAYLEQQGAAVAARSVATLMLLYNDPEAARKITRRAVVQPDRSGGKSRDLRQDEATSALLDWRANTDRAMVLSDHADILGGLRLFTRGPAWGLSAEAWTAKSRGQSVLHTNEVLIGMIRVGGPYGVSLAPWLVGELANIVGPGVFYNAVRRARDVETTDALEPYFDAYRADAEWAMGDEDEAAEYAAKAIDGLPDQEALLRARMQAILANEAMDDGDWTRAVRLLEPVVENDPGVLRRLGVPMPLRPASGAASAIFESLMSTDRYVEAPQGWRPAFQAKSVCLEGPSGQFTKCSLTERGELSEDEYAYARAIEFHDNVFRPDPPVDWLQLRGLDGHRSASSGNKGLRNLFSAEPDDEGDEE